MTSTRDNFFTHLKAQQTQHIILCAETPDFDRTTIRDYQAEGFAAHYISLSAPPNSNTASFSARLRHFTDTAIGVSEKYAIVAYGDAAAEVLELLKAHSWPKIAALVAYYPSTIPEPSKTSYQPGLSVLMHMCKGMVGVRRTPEVLGIQGKRVVVRREVEKGSGVGGELYLGRKHGLGDGGTGGGWKTYVYDVESGFAEADLDEFDPAMRDLAWSRTLACVRDAFGARVDLEIVRDDLVDGIKKDLGEAVESANEGASVICGPTLAGGVGKQGLDAFYRKLWNPTAGLMSTTLLSRTIGSTQIVDELQVEFKHTQPMPWILPNIPPTNRNVLINIVSIVAIKGGRLSSERMYWDQASVLVQVGLLDPGLVSKDAQKAGVKQLPVIGSTSADRISDPGLIDEKDLNGLLKGVKDL